MSKGKKKSGKKIHLEGGGVMGREKEGYREMLLFLSEKYPNTLTKKQAGEALGVSFDHLQKMINRGHIKVSDGKIPIGSVASYLCG